MSKKVLIVFSGLNIQRNEGAKLRLYSMIDSYISNGYAIDVLIFFPLSSFKYLFNYKEFLRTDVNWIFAPHIPITLNKFIYRFSILFSSFVFMIASRLKCYNIIQSETRCPFCKNKPKNSELILDVHGDSYDEYLLRSPNNKKIADILLRDMGNGLKLSDHIIFVSENLKSQYEKYFKKKIENYSIISCGVDLTRFKDSYPTIDSENKDKIILGYLGGLQKWQCIDTILDIIISLREKFKNIDFYLYTNSDIPEKIKAKLDIIGKENYMVKSLTFDNVPSNLSKLDAGLLIRDDLVLNKVSSPTKILEYLGAGVPLICNQYSGDYSRSVSHKENGFVFQNFFPSENELIELLDYLKKVKSNRIEYANKCKKSVIDKSFSYEFSSFIHKIIK